MQSHEQPRDGFRRRERGSALVVALLVLTVMMLLGGAFLSVSLTESVIAANEISAARAFNLAEAGIEHAKLRLDGADLDSILQSGGPLLAGEQLGIGTYTVSVTNNVSASTGVPADSGGATSDTDGYLVVTSTGSYRNASKTVQVAVLAASDARFEWALWSNYYISLQPSGKVYGKVGTNGNMILRADIVGDAIAGGTIDYPSRVSGTVTTGAPRVRQQLIACPTVGFGPSPLGPGVNFNPISGDLIITGSGDTWFPAGTYFFNKILKSGSGRMVVNAGDQVEIFARDALRIDDRGFDNANNDPAALKLWSCSPNAALNNAAPEWRFGATNHQWMVVYAPQNPLRVLGSGHITGSLVGKSAFKQGSGNIAWDSGLDASGGGAFAIVPGTWSELPR